MDGALDPDDMSAAAAFFAMGGHGLYVWGAWGLSVLALTGVLLSALRAKHRALNSARARRDDEDDGGDGEDAA